ncbi:DUF3572 domain-containing protein [Sphingomonas japonica]|uniref:DUF3572 family protein n=1 Tax=Sphingomonas japonica TaxID=511662 RepID=A0ABX0U0C8_9SPHN|nr:DUF3572 domain-containing protein [Sphingomonas japonica]NIJ24023.1 hypothetical protein [Sphingomonas japonica]
MPGHDTSHAEAIALQALAWTLGDPARADRLLALTGLDVPTLRARAGERTTLAAILGFLAQHEPDLVACADALAIPPHALIAAHATMENA